MKWFFFWFNFSLLLVKVRSLGLVLQAQTIVGRPSLVVWTRESTDANEFTFDLRFVQGGTDVGLASGNIEVGASDVYGTVLVNFPTSGQYVLNAVAGSSCNVVIGTSIDVTAVDVAPSTVAPTSTSSPIPVVSSTSSNSPSSAVIDHTGRPLPISTLQRNVNVPAIVGGIVGFLVFLGLLIAAIITLRRRRWAATKRFTFHKDMMVQRQPCNENPMNPRLSIVQSSEAPSIQDPERGLPYSVFRVPASAIVVPSPKGPRPSLKRPATPHTTIMPDDSLEPSTSGTRRQREISGRIAQLRGQMLDLQGKDGTEHVLDEMQKELVWLRGQEQSPWALGITDVPPLGYARYLTP